MNASHLLVAIGLLVPSAVVTGQGRASPAPADTQLTAAQLFGLLRSGATLWARSPEAWAETAREHGLSGKAKSGEQWTRRDSTGELRATVFFQEKTSVHLLFFPNDSTPIPEALLAHLLRTATATSLDDGDTLVLSLPERALREPGGVEAQGGRCREYVTVTLPGGRLVRTSWFAEWPPAK